MQAAIQKWGNSQGIRIPKSILDISAMQTDDVVDITAEKNRIIIKKAVAKRHKTLEERLNGFQGEYAFSEPDWGEPVGKEVW